MKRKLPVRDGTPENDAIYFLATRWMWLARLMAGKREQHGYLIDGFSIRYDGALWMVVVRAVRVEGLERVVAFGRAIRLYDALRNVTTTIGKEQWARDRFATRRGGAGDPN